MQGCRCRRFGDILPPFSRLIKSVRSADAEILTVEEVSLGDTGTKPAADTSDSSFKVGDKVLIFSTSIGAPKRLIGKQGVVIDVRAASLNVSFSDEACDWGFLTEDARPAEYEPAVGDVVEFDGDFDCNAGTKKCKGIIFMWGGSLYMWNDYHKTVSQTQVKSIHIKNIEKIGHIDIVTEFTSYDEAFKIAKAYFSEPDKDAPYADRQAAWVKKHGIKVGSKVKVVRKFEDNEGGFAGGRWDIFGWKAGQQGQVLPVYKIENDCIWFDKGKYPYFALEPV